MNQKNVEVAKEFGKNFARSIFDDVIKGDEKEKMLPGLDQMFHGACKATLITCFIVKPKDLPCLEEIALKSYQEEMKNLIKNAMV